MLARMLNVLAGRQPKVYVKYTSEMAKNIIPLYEGCTLANTVKYHILSAGCLATESYESADIVLFMTAPAGGMEEAMEQPSEKLEYCVERNIAEMFELLKYCISQKKIVTIADNAYANGGDLGIVKILNNNHLLMKVDGYAGWNTSANTLGTAIAEGVDSSKYGYAAIDQKEIREKISEYNMEDKVLMYPGADEVELTLLARMLNVLAGRQPKVYVKYTSEMAKNIIPLYEGCTLANTVKYHILSAGCLATESYESADIVLFMTAPAGGMEEAMEQPSEKLEYCVERNIAEMFELLKYCINQKKIVTIADNAYANGGDLGIVKILNNNHLLMKVDGYAGWNTSANTLGTAIAEGVDSYLNKVTEEHQRFLAERYVEDAGYCSVVRKSVTEKLPESMNYFDVREPDGMVASMVKEELQKFMEESLSSISDSVTIKKVSMPWSRMFEVNLEVGYAND